MNYNLTSNDRRILQSTINTVSSLAIKPSMNKKPSIKGAFTYAKLTEQNEDGFWSAIEIYFDETGTANDLTNGRTWGGDEPYILINGTSAINQIMRVESFYMVDSSSVEQKLWIGSAVGGGSSDFRLKISSTSTISKNVIAEQSADVVDYNNDIIVGSVDIIQNVFDTAKIYSGEILYGYINEGGVYAIDKSLLGV